MPGGGRSRLRHTYVMTWLARCWTLPNTLLGLAAGALMLAGGARVQRVDGVIEFHGGQVGRWANRLPAALRFDAITLGHVILGRSARALAASRAHEHVHVRQYERWGPAFVPAYVLASAWQGLRGRHAYRDNPFEREAYGRCPHRR